MKAKWIIEHEKDSKIAPDFDVKYPSPYLKVGQGCAIFNEFLLVTFLLSLLFNFAFDLDFGLEP